MVRRAPPPRAAARAARGPDDGGGRAGDTGRRDGALEAALDLGDPGVAHRAPLARRALDPVEEAADAPAGRLPQEPRRRRPIAAARRRTRRPEEVLEPPDDGP